jgi:hypothetical protein
MLRGGPYPTPSTSGTSSKTRVLLVDRMWVWWRRRGRRTEERELGQSGHSAHHRACLMDRTATTAAAPPQCAQQEGTRESKHAETRGTVQRKVLV